MSIKAVGMILEHSSSTLNPSEVLVLIAIANHVDDQGRSWPSLDKIAKNAHLSRRQVIRVIRQLEEKGEIEITTRKQENDLHNTNLYTLNSKYWGGDKLTPQGSDKLSRGSDMGDTRVVSPMSPKPSIEPSITKNPPLSPQIPIPQNLNTETFLKAWKDWHACRKEMGKKLTPRSEKAQLKMLAEYSPSVAIQIIETSIMNGYQGLFPPKVSTNGNGHQAPQVKRQGEYSVSGRI
jgi:DNA-binding transcriptional MocR family regulator